MITMKGTTNITTTKTTTISTKAEQYHKKLSSVFYALGDPTRFAIFSALLQKDEPCVSDLAKIVDVSVPAVSQHLRILELTGLVRKERMGRMVCYQPQTSDPIVRKVIKIIQN